VSALADAVRMEWVRVSTVRSTVVLLGLALLLPAGIAVLVGLNSQAPLDVSEVVAGLTAGSGFTPLPLPAVLAGVLGVLAVGHDYDHGTIRAVLTAVPRRSVLLTARLATVAGVVAVAAVAGLLLDGVALRLALRTGYSLDGVAPALAGYVLLLVLWAVVGAALALLMRGTTGPIVVLLVVPLLVEPLLGLLLSTERLAVLNPLARFLPFQAGRGMALPVESLVGSDPEALTRVQAVGVFCTFSAVLLALGWALFERRDA
jgi:ABC-2 type transport system permease protein